MGKREDKQQQKASFAKDSANLNAKIKTDATKRYAYLLGQTDIFAHFLNLKKQKGEEGVEELESALNVSKSPVTKKRLTEAEEDGNLLKVDEESEETIELTESPACTLR